MARIPLLLLCLAVTLFAAAQEAPRAEFFVGYSLTRIDISTNFPSTRPDVANTHGFATAFTWYFTRWVGASFDFGGNFASPEATFIHPQLGTQVTAEIENRLYTILVGPAFRHTKNWGSVFVRPAVGQFRLSQEVPGVGLKATDNDFAFAIGGGLDVAVHPHVALRVAPDYIRSYLTPEAGQNNWRFALGAVFH
jgi:opacity protein-like surface antigen